MFIFKLIVSILVGVLVTLIIYNYSITRNTKLESVLILGTALILILAIVCIWI